MRQYRHVRWLLGLALVLHLTGIPAATAAVCGASSMPRGHACCASRDAGQPHFAGHCGCNMDQGPVSPAPATATPGADGRSSDLIGQASAASAVASYLPPAFSRETDPGGDPPGSHPDSSYLAGGGFRC
jgi:hypothetical protein